MALLKLLAGLSALLLGRRVFTLFAGVAMFDLGLDFATLLSDTPGSEATAVAAVLGIAASVVAYVREDVMIAVVGFLAGGHTGALLLSATTPLGGEVFGVAYLIGGILGALAMVLSFDWSSILLSSFVGASLFVDALGASEKLAAFSFVGLATIGVGVQMARLGRPQPLPRA